MSRGGMRYGAGRPGHRAKAEHMQRVDIRLWRRGGYLLAGRSFTWRWNRDGDPAGSIGVQVNGADLLQLHYMVGDGDQRRDGSQTIRLDRSSCTFGGTRPWFVCPCCHRRAGLLFMRWGRFACRTCQQVAYASQSCDGIDRLWRKQAKIEARLGKHWQRPKGMWQRTYQRLKGGLIDCEVRREDAIAVAMARLFGGVGLENI